MIGIYCSFGMGGLDKATLNLCRALKNIGINYCMFYGDRSIPRATPAHHYEGYVPPSRQSQFAQLGKPIFIKAASDLNDYGIKLLHTFRSGEDLGLIPGLQNASINFKILETNSHGITKTRADRRIYPNQALFDKAGGHGTIIPHPIARPASNTNLRYKLGISDKFVFARIHRSDIDIYTDFSLKAYAQIQTSKTAFLWVGPNPQVISDAEKLGLKNIYFVDGTLDDEEISQLYNTGDVFCHSNRIGESFSLTIAEAMIHGLPVISHKGLVPGWINAHKELFGDHTNLYVESQSIDEYAKLMKRFMEDIDFWNETSSYLYNRATAFYSSEVVAQEYVKVYEEMLG